MSARKASKLAQRSQIRPRFDGRDRIAAHDSYVGLRRLSTVCPCVGCPPRRAQPQLLVAPRERLFRKTTVSVPQSQRQRQRALPCVLFGSRPTTTRRPNRWPVRSRAAGPRLPMLKTRTRARFHDPWNPYSVSAAMPTVVGAKPRGGPPPGVSRPDAARRGRRRGQLHSSRPSATA
jgi:hypothetical protein